MSAAAGGQGGPEVLVDDRLRRLLDGLPVVVWQAAARTGEFTFVSEHARALLGHPPSRWLGEPEFWASIVHPDDRDESVRRCRQHETGLDDYEFGYRAIAADGRVVWLRHLVHAVRDSHGAAVSLQGVLVDVSPYDERERFLAGLERELQPMEDAEEIMALVARRLGEHIGADRCAYARAEVDDDHFVMSGDYATGLPHLPGRFAMHEFGEGCLRAMRAGQPWVVDDSRNDDRLVAADLAAYEFTGIRAVICVPLHKAGRFVAAMAVHQASVRHWTRAEIELVAVVANRCWESLQRTHAGRALRDSEERYRMLVELATDGIWILDHDLRLVEVNPAACALIGYDRSQMLAMTAVDLASPEQLARLTELVSDPSAVQVLTEVWDVRRADGTIIALELSIQTTPTGLQAIGRDVTARLRAEAERELLMQREHEIVEALQRSLLPRELPALARLAASARYLPASTYSQIGGDWYEMLPITGTVVALSVGDVVGKGPTAAAVMGQLRSALAGYLLDGHSPAAALERLDAFARRTNGAAGSTCACLTFDWSTGELCWAAAGHPPPLVVEAGQPRFLDGGGAVLGVLDRPAFRDGTMVLTPGASVVLYTDGLVERRAMLIDAGLDHLLDVVREARHLGPDELTGSIVDALLPDGHEDDVALLVVRHIPEPLHRTVPAVPAELRFLRREVAAWASAAGLPATLLGDLQLTLGEAAANAVEHAYPDAPGDFDYGVARTADGGVHVTIRDRGRWRPEPADNGYRGRGLQIIRAIGERFGLGRGDGGTTVEFDLAGSPHPAPPVTPATPAAPATGLTIDAPDGVLRLTGALDVTTVDSLRDALLAHIDAAGQHPVEIDLTGLDYLSSSGVALLLEAATTATHTGRTLAITVADRTPPARILALSGLHTGGNLVIRTTQ